MFLPIFLKTEVTSCLIVGAGKVATNKVERLIEAGCNITILAPVATREVKLLAESSRLRWVQREYLTGDCSGFDLIIAATSSREVNEQVSLDARSLHIPVNVVDNPELCTVIFSAVWRDDPLIVAVSTSGHAPFMARDIRNRLAEDYNGLGQWVETGSRFRNVLLDSDNSAQENMELMKRFTALGPRNNLPAPSEGADYSYWMDWLNGNEKRAESDG